VSGVAVIRSLLAGSAAITAIVPPSRIMAGDLPLNTVMPAIAVTQISSSVRLTLRMSETPKMHTDRVQVSVLFKGPEGNPSGTGYPGVRSLLRLVLLACPNQRGIINAVEVDSILPDIEGPDLQDDETALYSCSRDFLVKWISAT
jgi:hypothetical protein